MLEICPNYFVANFRSANETRGPAASNIRTGRNQKSKHGGPIFNRAESAVVSRVMWILDSG